MLLHRRRARRGRSARAATRRPRCCASRRRCSSSARRAMRARSAATRWRCAAVAATSRSSRPPRLLRDAHLGSIWEGTGNIVALDAISRAIGRHRAEGALAADLHAGSRRPVAAAAYRDRLQGLRRPRDRLRAERRRRADNEADARRATSVLYHGERRGARVGRRTGAGQARRRAPLPAVEAGGGSSPRRARSVRSRGGFGRRCNRDMLLNDAPWREGNGGGGARGLTSFRARELPRSHLINPDARDVGIALRHLLGGIEAFRVHDHEAGDGVQSPSGKIPGSTVP